MKEYNTQKRMANKVQVYLEDEEGFFVPHQEILETVYKVMERCLEMEGIENDTEISLTVVDKAEIEAINKEYRGIDRVTDVLSFPQIEPESNGKIIWDDVTGNPIMLGDIILCHEKAIEQAEEYGHTLEREVCFLIAHSMFHLLGYDHMNEVDEKLMFEKQEQILKVLNIVR
ncbi:MAG: ybeY [Clostridia bacterium]|jgi:probable rRNA maturation factor|nr:ybeY [Clostridia bacterium]